MATATRSVATAQKIVARKDFKTYGSLSGSTTRRDVGQMPHNWREDFYDRANFIDFVVYSYDTPVAWHDSKRGWVFPDVKYSVTTSKQQGSVRYALHGETVRTTTKKK